jgi:hypothetical protein
MMTRASCWTAIDTETHRLFIDCRKPQKLVIMSTETGSVEAALPIRACNDAVHFDRGDVFASCGDGTPPVIGEKDGHFDVDQTVATETGAQTTGMDHNTEQIFLRTAEMLLAETGHRPHTEPGVVVTR